LDNPKLVAAMLEKGYVRDAKALEVIGGAWVAWCKPHSTEADRTRKPHLLGVLIRRLFGKNLHDTGVLARQFYAGFPTRQWPNLLANVDARAVFMTSLPLEQRKSYKTSSNLRRLVRVASARSPKCAAPAPSRRCPIIV
jgi:hypothetical protein